MRPPNSANGCAPHGIEEGLHALLITARRSVSVHVLNWDHPSGIELLHQISGLIAVVDLAATTHADDQHIRVTQQNLVGSRDRPGSGTYMGEIQPSLLPAPDGGLAETASLNPIMGAGETLLRRAELLAVLAKAKSES